MAWINLDKRLVLPILLGVSLTFTCVSLAVLFYPVYGKDDDTKRSRRVVRSRCITMKCKVPKELVSAVIGRGGSTIKNIQDKTDTHINMGNSDIESPYRICSIRGNEIENIRLAESMINDIIDNQPVIETYELLVEFDVFKNNRDIVQQIQRSTSTKIILENGVHKSEDGWKKKTIIKGTAEQIASAVNKIEDKCRQEKKNQAQLACEQALFAGTSTSSCSEINVEDIKNNEPIKETYKFTVAHNDCKKLTGNIIKWIQKITGAKILIQTADFGMSECDERTIKVRGTKNQITQAVTYIKDKIDKFDSDDTTVTIMSSESSESSSEEEDYVTEVIVSASQTPNVFWIQVIGHLTKIFNRLVSQMTEYYDKKENRERHALKEVKTNMFVATKFYRDDKWYRARVIEIKEDHKYEIFFVDFGEFVEVSIENVFELPLDMMTLRFQAVECTLANTKPSGDDWSPDACQKFAELVHLGKRKPLTAKFKGYKKRPTGNARCNCASMSVPCFDLYDKKKNIKDTLIHLGLAKEDKDIDKNSV